MSIHLTGVLIEEFVAETPEEVSLAADEVITILERHDDGWWTVEAADGRVGLCPGTYVKLVEHKPPPVARRGSWGRGSAPQRARGRGMARGGAIRGVAGSPVRGRGARGRGMRGRGRGGAPITNKPKPVVAQQPLSQPPPDSIAPPPPTATTAPTADDNKDAKKEAYRRNVVKEIITTEQEYVTDLDVIVQVFQTPLRESNILNVVELNNLFSNVEIIANLNRKVMEEFEASEREQGDVLLVGPTFLKMADFLKMYTTYCANQPTSLATLEALSSSNEQFAAFLQEAITREECRGLTLFSFLIKPIQRICKYPLLLRDLIKNTDETHPDYDNLIQAFDKIETVVDYVNERKRLAENLQRIMDIQTNIAEDLNLLSPSRRFVREAELMIMESNKQRERKVYLFNDMFLITKGSSKGSKEHLRGMFSLGDMRIVDVADTDELNNAFEVCSKSSATDKDKFSHIIVLPSAEEKLSWLKEIKQLVKEFQRKEAIKRKEALEKGEDPDQELKDCESPKIKEKKDKSKEKAEKREKKAMRRAASVRPEKLERSPLPSRPLSTISVDRPLKPRPPGGYARTGVPRAHTPTTEPKKSKKKSIFGLSRSESSPSISTSANTRATVHGAKPVSNQFKKKLSSSLKKGNEV